MRKTDHNTFDTNFSANLADIDARGILSHAKRAFVPKHDNWSGQWVWLSNSVFPDRQKCRPTTFCRNDFPYTVAIFRKTFDIPFVPSKATVWTSGDTKYRCRVNGTLVTRRPTEVGGDCGNCESPNWWFYEGLELEDCLNEGRNVIAVDVMLGPQVQADYSMGRGGFLLELLIEGAGGEHVTLCTDDTWRATLSIAESQLNTYDARSEPRGWTTEDFDDSAWPFVDSVGTVEDSPWSLLPREIPMLAEIPVQPIAVAFANNPSHDAIFPLTLEPKGPQTFRLQFPRELAGHVFLDMEGAEGTRVDIDFRELPTVTSERQETYILPGHRWSYQSRRLQGFETLEVTVTFPAGSQCGIPLTIHAIDAVFTSFPVEYRGCFECSEPFLNQLWAVGRWTNQLCMQSYHLDSPIHQEGLGCTGDYMIEALISYSCFGETRLARKDILRTAYLLKQKQGQMFHTSYSLLWVWMVRDYWLYSGDKEIVGNVMEAMHELLARFASYIGESGLITEAPNYMFMDWVSVGDYTLHHPPASMGQGYMSAFYFRALQYGAELSRMCQDNARAELYDQRAIALKLAFNDHLWCRACGLYRDGMPGATETTPNQWLPEDAQKDSFTVHTNALAVAVGIAPPDLGRTIMSKIMADETLPMVQPYFMHFVFEALASADLFEEYAFGIMDRWKGLLEEHPSSLKEMWDHGDYSHAWGGTPTYQLSTRVLGISVLEPGFRALSLRPRLGPLQTAKGMLPTARGPIEVSWKKEGGSLKGFLSGPSGCEVFLDVGRMDCCSINVSQAGRRIKDLRTTANGVCWTIDKGEYGIDIFTEQDSAERSH